MGFLHFFTPAWYKTQEMYHRVVSEDPFMIVYRPDTHQAVDDCLASSC